MKAIILCGGKFISYDQASAAARHGVLEKFITSRFDKRDTRIPIERVKSISLPAYIGYGWRRTPLLRNILPWNFISDNLFDLLASRSIQACDILHGWNNYSLYSMRRAHALGAKTVIERASAHPNTQQQILTEEWARFGFEYPRTSNLLFEKQVQEYEETDFIAVPSDFAYQSMRAEGVPASKLIKLPYGADLEAFEPQPKPDDVFRVFYAGMLSLQKGVYYLLEAWRQLKLPDAELVLAGTFRPNFKSIFAQYADEVTYLGWVDYWRLRSEYARASVFVLPSLHDGFGRVTHEAMACARPVIVTSNCGFLAQDGVDGFVVPPRDIEALKEKLLYFYENRDAAIQMGKAARKRALAFSTERYGDELVEIYRRISSGKDLSSWQPGL